MTIKQPFFELGDHVAVDLPGARALFTTRRGGFSSQLPWDNDPNLKADGRLRPDHFERMQAPLGGQNQVALGWLLGKWLGHRRFRA